MTQGPTPQASRRMVYLGRIESGQLTTLLVDCPQLSTYRRQDKGGTVKIKQTER